MVNARLVGGWKLEVGGGRRGLAGVGRCAGEWGIGGSRLEAGRWEVGRLEVGRLEVGRLEVGRLEVGRLEVGDSMAENRKIWWENWRGELVGGIDGRIGGRIGRRIGGENW